MPLRCRSGAAIDHHDQPEGIPGLHGNAESGLLAVSNEHPLKGREGYIRRVHGDPYRRGLGGVDRQKPRATRLLGLRVDTQTQRGRHHPCDGRSVPRLFEWCGMPPQGRSPSVGHIVMGGRRAE